ncbi:hypothetical protein BDZ94DRAFT_1243174 [Collybia nuda]|uniref:Uncharacterized protein n=1 Tax=Collybia nuda TaxID=64659 RepID=A0A9P5YJA6_9AGAR|nr:hypothetical protein BDZ94DRAFT_1243174 [Collybia nuda]
MRLLSSEDVMNGDVGDGGKNRKSDESRQSVWSMLEKLRHGRSTLGKKANSDDTGEGVMMYSPLEPKSDSQVEIAESELEYIDLEDFRSGKLVDEDQANGKGQEEATPPAVPNQPVLEKLWVPSTTNLSLYTTWWGYRLYLPPPVMSTLGDNQLKATKRAAMITAALQWFLNKIPLTMMPPQVRGAAVLLRRLLPLVGYIGVFIAWSWTRISARDKGNGVVLTATWLLPVALIPMAWDAGTIHGPSSVPLPPKDGEEATAEGNNAPYTDGNGGGSKSKKPRK